MNKRLFAVFTVCLLLCLALAACGPQNVQNDSAWGTVRNTESETELSLGMTREEVEKLLVPTSENSAVKPTEECLAWSAAYGDSPQEKISVMYNWKTDTVSQIQMEGVGGTEVTSDWSLADGITKGASKEEILAVYGKEPQMGDTDDFLNYYYDANDTLLGEDNKNAAYVVAFTLDEGALKHYCVMSTEFVDKTA